MKTFANAISHQETVTTNGMNAFKSTANSNVDLFFKIGASRGKDIIPEFVAAYTEDADKALRIAQWARDVRGGAGERRLFIDILEYLDKTNPVQTISLLSKVPEIGRWKDIIEANLTNELVVEYAFRMIKEALESGDGLCAKWAPRKGKKAVALRNYLGMTPKQYRKTLVGLTKVVESQMCSKDWDSIEFSKVPSLAAARYRTAFYRNAEEKFSDYVESLKNGEDKVKAGAVYPYDVLKSVMNNYNRDILSTTDRDFILSQWDALENFVGDSDILPMVDVSSSMRRPAGGYQNKSSVSCMDVAVSLGLYLSDKNTGKFKDTFLTFSSNPELRLLKGNVIQKLNQMTKDVWYQSTDITKAFSVVLETALYNNVPAEEMPSMIVIFSDMQFNRGAVYHESANEMIKRKYKEAGYEVPKIVYWNLNSYDNVPVEFDTSGTALVSGFSPTILKTILLGDVSKFDPESIMNETIMNETIMIDRYKL